MATEGLVDTSPYANSSLASDILYAFPRLAKRAGAFAVHYLPDQLDGIFGNLKLIAPAAFIAEATTSTNLSSHATNSTGVGLLGGGVSVTAAAAAASASVAAAGEATAELATQSQSFLSMLSG